jgi:hypothetical protein
MSGHKVFTEGVIWELKRVVEVPVTSHLRHQAFKAAFSNERSPRPLSLASSFGGYRRILTSSLKLWVARKVQLMGTTCFQFGCGV